MAPRRTQRRPRPPPAPAARPRNAPSGCRKHNSCRGCDLARFECRGSPAVPVLAVPAPGGDGRLAVRGVRGRDAAGTLLLGREADDKEDCLLASHFRSRHMGSEQRRGDMHRGGRCPGCGASLCLYLCPFARPSPDPLRCRACHAPPAGSTRLEAGECDTSGNVIAHLVGEAHCGRKHYRCIACGTMCSTRNNLLSHAAGDEHKARMKEVRWRVVGDGQVPEGMLPAEELPEPEEYSLDEESDSESDSDSEWDLDGVGHASPAPEEPLSLRKHSLPFEGKGLPGPAPAPLPRFPVPPKEGPSWVQGPEGDDALLEEYIRVRPGPTGPVPVPDAEPSGLYD